MTSLSNGLIHVHVESTSDDSSDSTDNGAFQDYENQPIESKETRLQELFPSENSRDISYTLKKSEGSFVRALDILLNHSFLRNDDGSNHEGAIPLKGIDLFSEDYVIGKAKKKKHKGRKFQSQEECESDEVVASSTLTPNRWAIAKDDIDFITSRTGMPREKISSTYHENEANRGSAILALVEQNISKQSSENAEEFASEPGVLELIDQYPKLSISHAAALLRITQSSTTTTTATTISATHDLAKAMLSSPSVSGASTPSRIVPRYVPYKGERTQSTPSSSTPSTPLTPTYSGSVASLSASRTTAFTQASAYYRKSKSDHLMGGAAAYYSQLGRDYHSSLQAISAAEADALATSQSTAASLDLHGLGVKDAVRIVCEKVNSWWESMGEARAKMGSARAVGEGYKVVTGVGRHSDGGVGKLGPAVVKALLREGWRVEVTGGELFVIGRARR